MKVEIINTGTELLLGRVLNTHQQWLCRQLAGLGWIPHRQMTVADTAESIQAAIKEAVSRSEVIIVTGGLGPTSDDLTRQCIAELLGRELVLHEEVLDQIRCFYASRARPMPESTRVQAYAPQGSLILPNPNGTAPGLVMGLEPDHLLTSGRRSLLVMLPGPPRELYPMFQDQVIPLLKKNQSGSPLRVERVLRTTGQGESGLEEIIAPLLKPLLQSGLELGYCARIGEVEIRLAAVGQDAFTLVRQAETTVCSCLGDLVFADDDSTLEEVVVKMLIEQKKTVAVAESCTGGLLAHRLTNVPGASAVFRNGWVTYSNQAKRELLGVPADLLDQHGAVSEPVARAMAEGARLRAGADFALATTGIAGPGGGTSSKPVGTVYVALATSQRSVIHRYLNVLDRENFKRATTQQGLDLLRREVGVKRS